MITPTSYAAVRTVFLDRDGVINEKMPEGVYVTRAEDFRLIAGVPQAIAQLNQAGLRVIIVTNQRGIAKELYSVADLEGRYQHFTEADLSGLRNLGCNLPMTPIEAGIVETYRMLSQIEG